MSRKGRRKDETIVVYSRSRLLDDPPVGTGPLRLVGRELGYYVQRGKGSVAKPRSDGKVKGLGKEQWVGSFVFTDIRRSRALNGETFTLHIEMLESLTGLYAEHAEEQEGPLGDKRENVRETAVRIALTFAREYETRMLPNYCPPNCMDVLQDYGILLDLVLISPAQSALNETQLLRLREFVWWFALRLCIQRKADSAAAGAKTRINGELAALQARIGPLEEREASARAEYETAAAQQHRAEESLRAAREEAGRLRERADERIARCRENLRLAEEDRDRAPEVFRERQTRALQVIAANGAESPQASGAKRTAEEAHAAIEGSKSAVGRANAELGQAVMAQHRANSTAGALTAQAERVSEAAAARCAAARQALEPIETELAQVRQSIAALNEELVRLDA